MLTGQKANVTRWHYKGFSFRAVCEVIWNEEKKGRPL